MTSVYDILHNIQHYYPISVPLYNLLSSPIFSFPLQSPR